MMQSYAPPRSPHDHVALLPLNNTVSGRRGARQQERHRLPLALPSAFKRVDVPFQHQSVPTTLVPRTRGVCKSAAHPSEIHDD